MKLVRVLVGMVVVVGLVAALAPGCAARESARIGVVLGGEGALAAQLALEAPADGGAPAGPPIELRILRGAYASSAQTALAAAESLASDPSVVAVVGHSNSSASLAASQVYNARHVVQIAPTTTAPAYANAGPYSFRLVSGDDRQAKFIAEQLTGPIGKRVAVAYVNDDYGRALRQLLDRELLARGIRPVYEGAYDEDNNGDAPELASSIASASPEMVVWLGRSTYFVRIWDSLRKALPGISALASDSFGDLTLAADTLHRFDGVRYVRLVDVTTGSPALQALRTRYARLGRGDLDDQAVLSFDAVALLAEGIREVGADREALRDWLNALGRSRPPFTGVTGPITFSPEGDRLLPYSLVTVGAPPGPAAETH